MLKSRRDKRRRKRQRLRQLELRLSSLHLYHLAMEVLMKILTLLFRNSLQNRRRYSLSKLNMRESNSIPMPERKGSDLLRRLKLSVSNC